MKTSKVFISSLAIIFLMISFLAVAFSKVQGEQIRHYKYAFFMGNYDLIDNYQKILEYEKTYMMETDIVKKKQILEIYDDFVYLIGNHSASARSLLYEQVNVDEYVVLESEISKEILFFQHASSDEERETHLKNLEVALNDFTSYMDKEMDAKGICIFDSCQ